VRTRFSAREVKSGVAWFFHAVGSGVFLDVPPSARVLTVKDRRAFAALANMSSWSSDTSGPARHLAAYMRKVGVHVLVLTNETTGFTVRRTELVALQPAGSGYWGGFNVSTGRTSPMPCDCCPKNATVLQCRGLDHRQTFTWGL